MYRNKRQLRGIALWWAGMFEAQNKSRRLTEEEIAREVAIQEQLREYCFQITKRIGERFLRQKKSELYLQKWKDYLRYRHQCDLLKLKIMEHHLEDYCVKRCVKKWFSRVKTT